MYLSNTNSGLHDKIIKCTVQSESFASLSLALNPREDKWRERVEGYGIVKSRKQVNHEYTQPAEVVSNIVLIGHRRAPLTNQQGSSSKRTVHLAAMVLLDEQNDPAPIRVSSTRNERFCGWT